jgi:hypothetical protein
VVDVHARQQQRPFAPAQSARDVSGSLTSLLDLPASNDAALVSHHVVEAAHPTSLMEFGAPCSGPVDSLGIGRVCEAARAPHARQIPLLRAH